MGIRKKIIIGFILIGMLLILSGTLSLFEFAHLNRDTAAKIKNNEQTLLLSKKLLDVVQQMNTSLMIYVNNPSDVYDSLMIQSDADFSMALLSLKNRKQSLGYIQRIEAAYSRYHDALLSRNDDKDLSWFVQIYNSTYSKLTLCIKDYMMYEQDEFLKYTAVLENDMYRAFMIGIIAFSSSLFLLISFYFLINLFFLSPVLKIGKSLRDFLKVNIPYSVKVETNDEIGELSSGVSELISKYRDVVSK